MSWDAFFTSITWFGSLYLLLPLSGILSLFLFWGGKSRESLFLGFSLLATVVAVNAAKALFRRPRPEALELLVPMPTGWSFPSGHTAQAAAFFLAVTIIATRLLPPVWAGACAGASVLIIVGVGWSRVYLQVHYLSDVLSGCVLAFIVVTAVHALLLNIHALFGE